MPEVTINGTRLNWTAEHYAGFWRRVERGEWEPQTYREIDRHVGADTIVLDLGANIGAIALYAARKAARVICFEPDPLSRANLTANIAVNPDIAGKITVIAKAVHAGAGEVRLGSQASGGDSMSSTILPDVKTTWLVETITPREINAMLPPDFPVFVKMDIEGGEGPLLQGNLTWLGRVRSVIAEFHPEVIDYPAAIRSIEGQGFRHIPAHSAADFDSMDAFVRVT